MERIQNKFGEDKHERGDETHVSDLCYCLLKIYCRLNGIERKQTKSNIGLMVFGIVAETVLAWTYPKEECQYKSHMPMLSEEEDIFGSIDIFEAFEHPLEVKASRKQVFKASQVPIQWIEQLKSYMSMEGCNIGWIIIFNIFSTQIIAFKMVLSREEILDWQIILSTRRTQVVNANKSKNPSILEIRPSEYGLCDYKLGCPRREECYRANRKLAKEKAEEKEEKNEPKEKKDDPIYKNQPFNPNLGIFHQVK